MRLRHRALAIEPSVSLADLPPEVKDLVVESAEEEEEEGSCAGCERKSLANTVKSYDKHLIICGYERLEQSRIETNNPFLEILEELLEGSKAKVRITACNHPNSSAGLTDILVYPDQIAITLNTTSQVDIACLSRWLIDSSSPLSLPYTKLPWKRLILVCHHAARDERCGQRGPQVIAELESCLRRRRITPFDVYVRASSHLGGHEFAGVVVVYPECDWYGYISRKNVNVLLDCILEGRRLEGCWRGSGMRNEW